MSDANCPHCGTPHRCCGTKIVRLSCRVPNKTIQTPLCLEREAHNKTKHERDEALLDKSNGDTVTMTISHYDCIISKLDKARTEADYYKAKYERSSKNSD